MSFIYLAVYKDGTSYIGQTINSFKKLEQRYRAYTKKAKARRPSEHACFALGMPAIGVIEYCPPEKLDEREQYWTKQHAQEGSNLNVANSELLFQRNEARRLLIEADKLRRMESKLAKAAKRAPNY